MIPRDGEPAAGRAGVADALTIDAGRGAVATTVDTTQWWGRYRLDQKVGEGAFGCVYRAWDPELERQVAVKILHKRVAETRLRQALLREGRALARVRDPHVVSVLGVESHEDQIALCMEFVYGETLEDVLARGPLSAGEATLVCQDVCRAVAAVHLAGFVHRDVKARNVMREKAGRIVLMDFGAGQDISQLAGVGRAPIAGTPLDMAPEVLAGESPSAISDVYSVGVLLYHLVTGQYPVEGQTLDGIRAAHMQGRRRLLSERRPELPVTFVQVVDKAIASDPTRRYASAAQFLEALVDLTDAAKKVETVATASPLVRGATAVLAVLLVALGSRIHSFARVQPRAWTIRVCPRDAAHLADLGAAIVDRHGHRVSRLRSRRLRAACRPAADDAPIAAGARGRGHGGEPREKRGAAVRPGRSHRPRLHCVACGGPVAGRRLLVLRGAVGDAAQQLFDGTEGSARAAVARPAAGLSRAVSQDVYRDHDLRGTGVVRELAAGATPA